MATAAFIALFSTVVALVSEKGSPIAWWSTAIASQAWFFFLIM